MNKILEKFSFYGIILFSFIGLVVVVTAVHEISHFYDYKNYSLGGDICILNLPTDGKNLFNKTDAIGYYSFYFNNKSKEFDDFNKIEQFTEKKATFKMSIVFFIFMVILIVQLNKRMDYFDKEKETEK